MNFTIEIKKEIVFKKMTKNETKNFIWGILCSNVVKNNEPVKVKLLNKEIFNEFLSLVKETDFKFKVINESTVLFDENQVESINPKKASFYFAGLFLSSGAISNLDSSSYHLEINFKNELYCDEILNFAQKHLTFHKIKNKNYYVLYIKKNEHISDFIQIIGAQKSYFEFIDSVIERDFKNQITRIFNLDVHNQNRLVDSNVIFKENLDYVKKNSLESKFNSLQLEFYDFKLKNEFLSLSQLSEELLKQKKIKRTKSGLNHWLIKLRTICEEDIKNNLENKKNKDK